MTLRFKFPTDALIALLLSTAFVAVFWKLTVTAASFQSVVNDTGRLRWYSTELVNAIQDASIVEQEGIAETLNGLYASIRDRAPAGGGKSTLVSAERFLQLACNPELDPLVRIKSAREFRRLANSAAGSFSGTADSSLAQVQLVGIVVNVTSVIAYLLFSRSARPPTVTVADFACNCAIRIASRWPDGGVLVVNLETKVIASCNVKFAKMIGCFGTREVVGRSFNLIDLRSTANSELSFLTETDNQPAMIRTSNGEHVCVLVSSFVIDRNIILRVREFADTKSHNILLPDDSNFREAVEQDGQS